MKPIDFATKYRDAFGNNVELPIAFWYSSEEITAPERHTRGCMMKYLAKTRKGEVVTFDADSISCEEGKVNFGFANFAEKIAAHISQKQRYKKTPQMVWELINKLKFPKTTKKYLNFAPVDHIATFDNIEGLIFFTTPDVLCGLISWTLFDANDPDAVSVPFGAGCSTMIAHTVVENRQNGKRTFIGGFDPTVRHLLESDVLTFAIPRPRLLEMLNTFSFSCLNGTTDWLSIKNRIKK